MPDERLEFACPADFLIFEERADGCSVAAIGQLVDLKTRR
jgi:hypothetical protein